MVKGVFIRDGALMKQNTVHVVYIYPNIYIPNINIKFGLFLSIEDPFSLSVFYACLPSLECVLFVNKTFFSGILMVIISHIML